MRLVSALLAGVAALCAFLTVRELAPRRQWLAVAAGLLVAFQPMVAFMFGVVNNDAGVNAAAALLVFLLVRGLRRGLTVPLGIGLGVTLALLPAMKATGAALYPAAVRGDRSAWSGAATARADLRGYGALAGGAAAVPRDLRRRRDRASRRPGRRRWGRRAAPAWAARSPASSTIPSTFLSYTWQMFLPRLPFMTDLHVQTVAGLRRVHQGRLGRLRLAGRPLPAVGVLRGRGRQPRDGGAVCGGGAAPQAGRRVGSAGSWRCSSSRSPAGIVAGLRRPTSPARRALFPPSRGATSSPRSSRSPPSRWAARWRSGTAWRRWWRRGSSRRSSASGYASQLLTLSRFFA